MRVLGAVLAGGVGRRFGGDKALAEIDGRTLIARVIAALALQTETVVVCGRALSGVVSLVDRPGPGLGPLAGIAAALHHAGERGFDAVLTVPCDTPFLPADLCVRLGAPPAYLVTLPLIGLWPAGLADIIDAELSDPARSRSVRSWAERAGARAVASDPLVNVNTPADLAALTPPSRRSRALLRADGAATGGAMLNDTSSTRALLATRRSGKLRDMGAPGPDPAQLGQILAAAMRVPDHGKLAPWRFVIVPAERRAAFAALLERACRAERGEPGEKERRTIEDYAAAPTVIVVLSLPRADAAIPLWEQELSAGAACMNLLVAAHAEGFVGSWLTGWPAYSDIVRDAFDAEGGKIAGFLFLGTAIAPLSERPRPDAHAVVREWSGIVPA